MKKRNLFIALVLVVVALAVVVVYPGLTASKKELHLVRTGTGDNPYMHAWDEGIVECPVSVKKTFVENLEALGLYVMGEQPADLVQGSVVLAGMAYNKDPRVRILGASVSPREGDTVLVTRKDAGITSAQDLRGKKVGIAGLSLAGNIWFRKVLKENYGVGYDQIQFIQKPMPTLLTILEKGQVDAVVVFGVFAKQAAANPNLVILLDVVPEVKTLLGDYPIAVVTISNQDLVDKRGADLKQLMQAFKASAEYVLAHKDQVAQDLAPKFGLEPAVYLRFAFGPQPANIYPLTEGEKRVILQILDMAHEQGLMKERVGEDIFW